MRTYASLIIEFTFVCLLACLGCSEDDTHNNVHQEQTEVGILDDADIHAGPDIQLADATFQPSYPMDETLRMNHLQGLGTHNSYHLQSDIDILPWRYSHLPLDEQLGKQGVRQFELDIFESEAGVLEVYHIAFVDARSTCPDLAACLTVMKGWSDQHQGHHPILVLLETTRYRSTAQETIEKIEEILASTWSRDRLVTPALVQRNYASIREGLEAEGWPTLGETRGRLMAVLHTSGSLRNAYLESAGSTKERLMFPDAYGNLEADYAAFHSINNPIDGQATIQAVVEAGHLVRTRADEGGEESETLDYTKANAALSSGAHFISTDFPFAATETTYGFIIPEGTPSRCNPISAPDDCNSADLENEQNLGP